VAQRVISPISDGRADLAHCILMTAELPYADDAAPAR